MRLGLHQVLSILVSFYVWASLARSLHEAKHLLRKERYFDKGDRLDHSALAPRNSSELVVRDDDVSMLDDSPPGIGCRTLCSAALKPIKRDWRDLNPHSALEKRYDDVWPPLGGDKGKDRFMVNAFSALRTDQAIVPKWAETGRGQASAVTATLGNTKIRFGMQHICGCTMLFVVSRKRVYLGHYWEAVSFGRNRGEKYELHFTTQVTDFLKSGFQAPGGPAQDSLQKHAADFQGDPSLVAYILSPDTSNNAMNPNDRFLYPDKVQLMASTIASILGIDTNKVVQKTYVPADGALDEELLKNTAAGRMIFDYDPTGGPEATRRVPKAGWRIIWQKELILADQWDR